MTPRIRDDSADLARRIAWLSIARTLLVAIALSVSIGVAAQSKHAGAIGLLSGLVVLTLACNVGYGVALRSAVPPRRVAKIQLLLDVIVTSLLVYLTGGARSPYVLLYATTVLTAGAVLYRRGAVIATLYTLGWFGVTSFAAWLRLVVTPATSPLEPWTQTGADFARSLGGNVAALLGVGALAFILADQLERAARSLATERTTVGDLFTLYQDIVASLASGLITTNKQGEILSMNATAEQLLGVPSSQAQGQALDTLLPGMQAKIATPGSELKRATYQRKIDDEIQSLGISVSLLRNATSEQLGYIVNFQDLTELRRLENQMQRTERLATVGQLAAGVAHEIRNPLAAISGSIELLRQAPQASDDDKSLMAIVTREIDRLNELITELLDYANPKPLMHVEFDLALVVDEVVQIAKQDANYKHVQIEWQAPGATKLTGDAAKLRQVVWNLLRNACEAVRASKADGGHVELTLQADAANATLQIRDTGPGIPPDRLARIFDPFFTTKAKGTGLGLAVCHSIVTNHGGFIDVQSELDVGTRMTVAIPRGDLTGAAAATLDAGPAAGAARA